MQTTHTIDEFEAQGLSPCEAAASWYSCWERDTLNALNKAMDHGLSIMLGRRTPKRVSVTVEVLRDSAGTERAELRRNVAKSCARWFEVPQ